MKKVSSLFVFSLLCAVISAQPSLTRAKMLPFGSVDQMATASDISVLDTTKQGANVTWDFTALQDADPTNVLSYSIANPVNTPYYSTYPTSNYVQVERNLSNGVEQGLSYNYFLLTDTKMERLGSQSVYTGSSSIYSDPQVEYVFPMTYNTSNNDTWASSASSFGGTYDLKCIGYGTLKLPGATYNNVLMVRVLMVELFTYTSYFWYNADNGAVLANYMDMSFFGQTGIYSKVLTVAAVNEGKKLVESIKYNNPVDNTLNIRFDAKDVSELEYTITNPVGKTLLNGNMSTIPSQANTFSLDLSSLNPGMYFMTIRSNKSGYKQEVIKIMKK